MGRELKNHMYYFFGGETQNYNAIQSWLVKGETILAMYEIKQNICVFTDKRIIVRGTAAHEDGRLIGKEVYSMTIPYRNVSMFSYEVSDTTLFNAFKYVDLWIISGQVVTLVFPKNADIAPVKKFLRERIVV